MDNKTRVRLDTGKEAYNKGIIKTSLMSLAYTAG